MTVNVHSGLMADAGQASTQAVQSIHERGSMNNASADSKPASPGAG